MPRPAERDHAGAGGESLEARLSELVAAILRISEDLDVDVVLQEVVDGARSLTGARFGAITTLDDDGDFQSLLVSGTTADEQAELLSYPRGRELFGYLTGLVEPLRTPDLVEHLAAAGFEGFRPLIGAFIGAQIRVSDRHVGTIYIGDRERGEGFTRRDEEMLELFAKQAAMAITNARRYDAEQRAKADLEALVDTSPVGVLVFDERTRQPVTANREARRIFGIPDGQDPDPTLAQLTFRRMDGTMLPGRDLSVVRSARAGETMRAEELVIERPDGESVSALVNATPIRSEVGEVMSIVATVQDITPLEELERLRAEFLGMVSHELRGPLASIKGAAATAGAGSVVHDPAETQQFFRMIEEQADHMRDLISNLLDLTRIEAGTLSVTAGPTDVASVIEQAKNAFVGSGHRIDVAVELAGDLPQVQADRQRLAQVLYNLLANAARHSRKWSTITVAAVQQDQHVAVSVTDEGTGIAAERLPRLFTKFSRGDTAAGPNDHRSYGLGLAICKGIVEAHGGRIWAASDGPGRGARFTFTVPTVEEATPSTDAVLDPAAASSRNGSGGAVEADRGAERILAIDDDPQMLRTLRNTLLEGGYQPILADDADDAERLIRDEPPALVLLDLVMHGTDGFELMEKISSTTEAPVIFVSGRGDDRYLAKAFDMGAADYIVKPFSPVELLTRIRAALRRRAQSRHAEPYRLKDLTVDYLSNEVTIAGRQTKLTPTEYRLLAELCSNSGQVLTYDQLIRRVWGPDTASDPQRLRTFVKDLRNKLGDNARSPSYIFTVSGVGYRAGPPK